jgi:hypothetical protein
MGYEAGLLLGLLFDPEDASGIFFRSVGCLSTVCTALFPEDITRHKNHRLV